jgi:hypothetical protein
MIESPLIEDLQAEAMQEAILDFLEGRFSTVPADLAGHLRKVRSQKKLKELAKYAGRCPDLEAFREKLLS